jgi:WD40 repeat protein
VALMAGAALALTSCAKPSDSCADGRAHKDAVGTLAISPDGKLLVSGSRDKTIKLWSLPDGALMKALQVKEDAFVISPDWKLLAERKDGTIDLRSLPDGELVKPLKGHRGYITSIAITPDGKLLVSRSTDKTIKLWSLPDGNLIKTLEGHRSYITSIAIAPDGKLLASGGYDKTIKLWSLPDGNLIKTLEGDEGAINSFVIYPDGKLLISRGYGIKLWSLPDGSLMKTLRVHGPVISRDWKLMAEKVNKTIRLWSLPDGNLMKTLEVEDGTINFIAIVPDGKLLVSGSGVTGESKTIKLWSLPDGKLVTTRYVGVGWTIDFTANAIAPDGKLLATGNSNGSIHLRRLPDGRDLTCLIDLDVSPSNVEGSTYMVKNAVTGQTVTYTLPCGSPLPSGATCTCDCVPGSACRCVGDSGGSGGRGAGRCICMAVRCR